MSRLRPAPSLQRRLARAVLMLWLLLGMAVALAVWLAVHEEVDELLDDTLRASAAVLGAMLPPGAQSAAAAPAVSTEADPGARFAWQVVTAARVEARSPLAPAEPFVAGAALGFSDTPLWRVYGSPLGAGGRVLYVAQTRAERAEAQFEAALQSVLAALAIGLLGYVGLRAQLRHELAPLQRLSEQLDRHEPLAPGATLGVAERAEFESVVRAVDRLGERLAHRLAHERAFTAHAAHALRTPLAGIDAQLALCLRESPAALQPRLQRAREAAGRLQRVLVALLTLFRSEGEPLRQAIDVKALLDQVPLAALQIEVQAEQPLRADSDLLAAALMNLLDNAQRHGATRVVIGLPSPQTVRIEDDGPGMAAAQRQELAAALAAQDYERVPGLGLALADLVARAHGGRLTLPESAGGFAVELSLGGA